MIRRSALRGIVVSVLAVTATPALATPPPQASLSPALSQALQAPAPGPIRVIVTLRDQAPLDGAPATRPERLRTVEQRLQDHASKSQKPIVAVLRRMPGVQKAEPLWIFNGLALTATEPVIRAIAARADVATLDLDLSFRGPATTSATATVPVEAGVQQIGAPALWNLGFRGAGVTVAVLDTGADATHPDLAAGFRGGPGAWFDANGEHPTTPTDVSGHGTAMLGVMVGGSAGGSAIGVAPLAKWIAAKIFNDRGVATTSGVHQAFQWVLDPDHNPATADAPNVVNASWTTQAPGCDLTFEPDLRALRAAGILPVFAAGNSGPLSASSASPANNPEAFAVGAVDATDALAPFSARGPSACGEASTTFPEVVAPGVNVRSADLFAGYRTDSGTSLAAAHVSGLLALLDGAFPNTTADRQASALQRGAGDLGPVGADDGFGAGRADALGAYNWLRTAPDFALSAAPTTLRTAAGGTATSTLGLSSRNGFASDVTLAVSGLAAGQGTATVTPSTLHGGAGTATLSIATAASLAPGSYPVTVTATGGGLVRTVALTLQISGPPDFTVAVIPAAATVPLGGSATLTVDVGALNGFAAPVTLSAAGLPAGGRATFTPNPFSAPGTGTVRLSTSGWTRRATYTITIAGTSGTLRHTATVAFTVR